MAKTGRNEPCGCGSRLKAKRCCGVTRGPSEDSLAVAFVMGAARDVAGFAGGVSGGGFARVLGGVGGLPCLGFLVQVEIPKGVSPAGGGLLGADPAGGGVGGGGGG